MSLKMKRGTKEKIESALSDAMAQLEIEDSPSEELKKKELALKRLCLYTITGVETLHPDFEHLKDDGVEPEQVILYKLLSMFGPVSFELIAHINDEYWGELLTALSVVAAEEDPIVRFAQWEEKDFPNLNLETKRMILRMTNLDPKKRATMEQIMEDPWWK
ncbi:MAG: hypothetical protein Q9196_006857 [Gyalolechia fulgens]